MFFLPTASIQKALLLFPLFLKQRITTNITIPIKKVSKIKHTSPTSNDSIPQDIPVVSTKKHDECVPNANMIPTKDIIDSGIKVKYASFQTPQDSKDEGFVDTKFATIDTKSVSNNLSAEFNKTYLEALTYNLPEDDLSGIPSSELGPFFKRNEKKKLNMTFEAKIYHSSSYSSDEVSTNVSPLKAVRKNIVCSKDIKKGCIQ